MNQLVQKVGSGGITVSKTIKKIPGVDKVQLVHLVHKAWREGKIKLQLIQLVQQKELVGKSMSRMDNPLVYLKKEHFLSK